MGGAPILNSRQPGQAVSTWQSSRSFCQGSEVNQSWCRVLFQFAEQQRDKVRTVYLVSGWSKQDPPSHVHQLVEASQLQGAGQAMMYRVLLLMALRGMVKQSLEEKNRCTGSPLIS